MSDPIAEVFDVVAEAAPEVRASLPGRREYETAENPSGEQRLVADVHADRLIGERLLDIDAVASYGSEERESVEEADGGHLHVACDPLDGSSNLKSNNVLGTIVGVYDEPIPAQGRSLRAAGFVCYGPITTLTMARDGQATEYIIDTSGDGSGVERRPVEKDLQLPSDPVVYGFGGRVPDWTDAFTDFAREVEQELKLRYGGAMIGDINQVLEYGGIFAYPALQSRPEGKLRLGFEGNPIGYVIEAAGGRSSDGTQSLLDVEPTEFHQRVPVYIGNAELVERLEAALAE